MIQGAAEILKNVCGNKRDLLWNLRDICKVVDQTSRFRISLHAHLVRIGGKERFELLLQITDVFSGAADFSLIRSIEVTRI